MLSFNKAKKYLQSPVRMEPAQSGRFAIEVEDHPPGYKECAVSMRTAFLSGQRARSLIHVNGVRRHHLVETGKDDKKGMLMSDIAQEMIDFAQPIYNLERLPIHSNVLIGGLGLGYIAQWAGRMGHRVTVVEIEPDIIRLISPYLPATVSVVQGDLLQFLGGDFDARQWPYAIFDTWYQQNEATYWGNVMPLRRAWYKARGNPKRLWCWKEEDEMQPQIMRSTLSMWMFYQEHPEKDISEHEWPPHEVFMQEARRIKLNDPNMAEALSRIYATGLSHGKEAAKLWEKRFGPRWDYHMRRAEAEHAAREAQRSPENEDDCEDEGCFHKP